MPTSIPGKIKNMPQLIYDQMKMIKLLPKSALLYLEKRVIFPSEELNVLFSTISDCSAFQLVKWLRFNENRIHDEGASKNRYTQKLHQKILNLF